MNKIVLYPITVPIGDYCWEYNLTKDEKSMEACRHFDDYHGYPNCDLRFGPLKRAPLGVKKPLDCGKLKEDK
jgi:hypothetical protein